MPHEDSIDHSTQSVIKNNSFRHMQFYKMSELWEWTEDSKILCNGRSSGKWSQWIKNVHKQVSEWNSLVRNN